MKTISELTPEGQCNLWSFGHHDVYEVVVGLLPSTHGNVAKAVGMLPTRITAAIWMDDAGPPIRLGGTDYFQMPIMEQ